MIRMKLNIQNKLRITDMVIVHLYSCITMNMV